MTKGFLAKHVGYAEPIVGWEWAEGQRKNASWWPTGDDDEAHLNFLPIDDRVEVHQRLLG